MDIIKQTIVNNKLQLEEKVFERKDFCPDCGVLDKHAQGKEFCNEIKRHYLYPELKKYLPLKANKA